MKSIIYSILAISYITLVVTDDFDPLTDEYIVTEITGPYKMGELITCYEQNDQSYQGYKDKVYSDEPDKETGEISEMCTNEATKLFCDRYKDPTYPNPGRGDVCDHTAPSSGIRRNACYFNTIYGDTIDEEKTWSYKCWEISECPLKGEDGLGRVGCQVTNRRINCCCQEDYCNGGGLIEIFAAYGNPDNYPPDFEEICAIDFSQYHWYVWFNVPSMSDEWNAACTYDPDAVGNDDQYDIIDQITDDQGTSSINDNDPDQLTNNQCIIIDAISRDCSCGGGCNSKEYEYTATSDKCGDTELTTGEFGAETCNPDNPVYEIGDTVSCQVTDCANGEFRILNDGYIRNVSCINLLGIFCILWILTH